MARVRVNTGKTKPMVLLRDETIAELAPLVGEVVMRYAAMEGDFLRLETAVHDEGGASVPEKELKASLCCRLELLRDKLRAMGQADAADRLAGEHQALDGMIKHRNHLVHGEWVWAYGSDEVQTVKYPRGKNDPAAAEPRPWDASKLRELVEDIKRANRMINQIAARFRKGPDGQPMPMRRTLRGPQKRPEGG